ncbi:MAG: hypothetical protein ACREP6_06260 [Candidatus Binataceae bacterium]
MATVLKTGGVWITVCGALALLMGVPGKAYCHFDTLPPNASLPTDAQCAQWVMASPTSENRPDNEQANQSVPAKSQLQAFWSQPTTPAFAPPGDFTRVDGNFKGTTDEIIRWAACKWGIDEDVARAEAVAETNWH